VKNFNSVPNMCQKSLPEITSEFNIHVGHNSFRQTVQFNDTIENDFGHSRDIRSTRVRQKVGHFRKAVHDN